MEYTLPEHLKASILDEIGNKNFHNKKVIFASMAKEVFPEIKNSALLIGEKLELISHK